MRSANVKVVRNSAALTNVPPVPVSIHEIPLDAIDPSTTQPRQHFDDDRLRELAASIQQQGVVQPIIVRPRGDRYELIAGERRVRASRLAGRTTIPAQIRDIDDQAARQVQIIENLQREGIHALEEADAYHALIDSDKACTPEVIAVMVGKSKRYVYQCLTYRRLIPEARDAFARNVLTAAHAARIAQIPEALQADALAECFFPVLARGANADAIDARALAPLRQLDAWIHKRVQLDAHSEDTQVLLPELAEQVADAESNGHGAVIPLSTMHFHTDRTEPKPILSQSWKRSEGRGKCKYARTGVIVLGEGRGTLLSVCIDKKKCTKHWPPRRTAKAAERGEQQAEEQRARERREAYEREQQEHRFYREHLRPAILEAIRDNTKTLKFGPHVALLVLRRLSCFDDLQKLLGPVQKLPPARLPQALALAAAMTTSWNLKDITPVARHFRVNVKSLRAKLMAELATAAEQKTA